MGGDVNGAPDNDEGIAGDVTYYIFCWVMCSMSE